MEQQRHSQKKKYGRCAAALILALNTSGIIAYTNLSGIAVAASSNYPLEAFTPSTGGEALASLQRGAKYFVNYCLSCHSAQYSRYSRVGKDLELSDELVKENLMFTEQKIGDTMDVAMTDEEATAWFGAVAPDLTLITRSRSPEWVYTYLKSFYLDDTRPMGVNNALFQNVAMPHVLWRQQGWQKPVYGEDHNGQPVIVGLEVVEEGKLKPGEYDKLVRDIVNFLTYLGEPVAEKRKSTGVTVVLFLLLLLVLAYLLKREYWRDIH